MKFFICILSTLILMSCQDRHIIRATLTETELTEMVENDELIQQTSQAFAELSQAYSNMKRWDTLSTQMKLAIKNGDIKSIEDYKKLYIKKGGDSAYIYAFSNAWILQKKVRQKYHPIIKANRPMFKRVVQKVYPDYGKINPFLPRTKEHRNN